MKTKLKMLCFLMAGIGIGYEIGRRTENKKAINDANRRLEECKEALSKYSVLNFSQSTMNENANTNQEHDENILQNEMTEYLEKQLQEERDLHKMDKKNEFDFLDISQLQFLEDNYEFDKNALNYYMKDCMVTNIDDELIDNQKIIDYVIDAERNHEYHNGHLYFRDLQNSVDYEVLLLNQYWDPENSNDEYEPREDMEDDYERVEVGFDDEEEAYD